MTQDEDEKRQARRAGGLRTAHGTDERGAEQLQSIFTTRGAGRGGGTVGSSQGSRVTLHQHPVCQTHIDQNQRRTFPSNIWGWG